MSFVLFNREQTGTPKIVKTYATHKEALRGLRTKNRHAGWTRITRGHMGVMDLEWCVRTTDSSVNDHGPFAVMHEVAYRNQYKLDQMVQVRNLMTGLPAQIRAEDRGTCLDPSQERFWSM